MFNFEVTNMLLRDRAPIMMPKSDWNVRYSYGCVSLWCNSVINMTSVTHQDGRVDKANTVGTEHPLRARDRSWGKYLHLTENDIPCRCLLNPNWLSLTVYINTYVGSPYKKCITSNSFKFLLSKKEGSSERYFEGWENVGRGLGTNVSF